MSNKIDLKIFFAYLSTSLVSGQSEEMELFFQANRMFCETLISCGFFFFFHEQSKASLLIQWLLVNLIYTVKW